MNESSKHVAMIAALIGSVSLAQWNTIVGLVGSVLVALSAALSIYSWFEKRRRRAQEAAQAAAMEKLKKKHHHWLLTWLVLAGAVLVLAGAALAEETNSRGGALEVAGEAAEPRLGTTTAREARALPDVHAVPDAWAATVAADASKLVYDFLSGFSMAGVLAIYLAAKGLRNKTPLGSMKGIGTVLNWINLEAAECGVRSAGGGVGSTQQPNASPATASNVQPPPTATP